MYSLALKLYAVFTKIYQVKNPQTMVDRWLNLIDGVDPLMKKNCSVLFRNFSQKKTEPKALNKYHITLIFWPKVLGTRWYFVPRICAVQRMLGEEWRVVSFLSRRLNSRSFGDFLNKSLFVCHSLPYIFWGPFQVTAKVLSSYNNCPVYWD